MSNKNKLIIGLAAVIFTCCCIVASNTPKQTTSKSQDKAIEAFIVSQEFVKARLKAPSTAKFPGPSQAQVLIGKDNQYRVISYVDSQNSFGAMLRGNYECLVKYDPAKDKWFPVTVDIDQ
jgi:hypothetical protein